MSAVTPALGGGMVVKVNSNIVKAASFQRRRSAGRIPLPTSGLTANADSVYEIPHAVGMVTTEIVIRAPYDTAAPFHSATYLLRPGKTVTAQFGMISTLLTPAISYKVADTTDSNEAERTGEWEAVLVQATDDTAGFYTEAA